MSLTWSAFTVCGENVCSVKRGNKRSKCYFQLVSTTSPKGIISLLIMSTAVPTAIFQSGIQKRLKLLKMGYLVW